MKRMPKRGNPTEAQATLLDAVASITLHTEIVDLQQAVGRVFAKACFPTLTFQTTIKPSLTATQSTPKTPKKRQSQSRLRFKVVGKLFPADYPTDIKAASYEAVYVACGAPIPKGALATVKVEETRLKDGKIEVVRAIKPGEGIIPLGDDVKQGELILPHGQVLRPQDVRFSRRLVWQRPKCTKNQNLRFYLAATN